MARRARVDWYGDQKNVKVPTGVSVTWHTKIIPKEATITADTDILLDEFKTNAHSTTEIIPKFEFTRPAPEPDLIPDADAIKRTQAKENYDAVLEQQRIDGIQAEFDKL